MDFWVLCICILQNYVAGSCGSSIFSFPLVDRTIYISVSSELSFSYNLTRFYCCFVMLAVVTSARQNLSEILILMN